MDSAVSFSWPPNPVYLLGKVAGSIPLSGYSLALTLLAYHIKPAKLPEAAEILISLCLWTPPLSLESFIWPDPPCTARLNPVFSSWSWGIFGLYWVIPLHPFLTSVSVSILLCCSNWLTCQIPLKECEIIQDKNMDSKSMTVLVSPFFIL